MSAPRVSIGMPAWNSNARHVTEAIDSLLAQTFGDFELLLADNGSDEPARSLYVELARRDRRIRLVRHEVNRGALFNFRFVLEQARGELFMWAADDDSRAPELLARLVAALEARPECVSAGSCVRMIDSDGRPLGRAGVDMRHIGSRSPARRMLALYAPYSSMDVYGLHRRRMIENVDLTVESIWADRHWMTEILLHGPIARLDAELFYYRNAALPETYARRARQHFGEHAAADGDGDPSWARYDYAGTALRVLSKVLTSRAPLTPAERAECFAVLAGVFAARGWFTRDRFYKELPELQRALRDRDLAAALRAGLLVMLTSPTFPFTVGAHKAAARWRAWRGRE